MVVAIDVGDRRDIHPHNKQEVGRRLGLLAAAKVYGGSQTFAGPEIRRVAADGNRLRLSFRCSSGELVVDGDRLQGFEVAGRNGNFHAARAAVDGNEVIVWAEQVPEPRSVRYDWSAFPNGNLRNKALLPAGPFQADAANQTLDHTP
jgi:sialate O-acetylesterase